MTEDDSAPWNYRALDHVVIRARDIQRMLAFYSGVMGMPIERELEQYGLHQLRAGNALIDLVDCEKPLGKLDGDAPDGTRRNMAHFCLTLEAFDADAIKAWLADNSVDCDDPEERYGATGTGYSIYLSDPEGNVIELKEDRPV